MDVEGAMDNLEKFKSLVNLPIYPVSAISDSNLDCGVNGFFKMDFRSMC